jgi:hypothetical protein
VKYAAIADWAADKQFSVTFMCARLGVVRQGCYRWLAEGPCERERTDAELTETIREIHAQLHGHPGVRRVWAELVARPAGGPQADLAADARRRPTGTPPTSLETHHRGWSAPDRRRRPDRAGLHRRAARHALVR